MEQLSKSSFGRIILHLVCMARNRRFAWHIAGIKREILLLSFVAVVSALHAAPNDTFFTALHSVESGLNSTPLDGDNGKAIGPFQIWRAYWQDAVAFDPQLGGTYADCRNYDYARKVVSAYLQRYARTAWQNSDFETLARIHNGGPKGAQKQATLGYWLKVQKALQTN